MNYRCALRYIHVTLLAFKNLGFVCIYAILLSVIPIVHPGKPARAAYILLFMTGLWITEAIPIYVTALLPIFMGPLFGLASSMQISSAYMKDTNMLFLGGLIVACTLEYRNFHKRLAVSIFRAVGGNPKMILLGLMVPSWFLSMWMSNTATTAMMITIVEAILVSLNKATIETIIGKESSPQENSEHLHELTADMERTVEKLESNEIVESGMSISSLDESEFITTKRIERIRKLNIAFSLGVCYASSCGGIATLTGTPPNSILYGMILNFYGPNTGLNYGTWVLYALPISVLMLLFTWFWLCILYIGLKESFRCDEDLSTKEVIKEVIQSNKKEIGEFSYAEGQCCILLSLLTILWVTRNLGPTGWGKLFDSSEEGSTKYQITDSAPAILIAVLCMILPAWNPIKLWKTCNQNYELSTATITNENQYLLPWSVAKEKIPWGVIIVVGGGFALADICKSSGLSDEIGKFLSEHLVSIPTSLLTLVCSVSAGVLTEFASNAATVSILTPIVISLSQTLKVHPFQLAIPTALATSFAFSLPASTPPNTIVFARGRIRVTDMLRSGVVVNLMGSLVTLFAISTYAKPLFGLDTYPVWAQTMKNYSMI